MGSSSPPAHSPVTVGQGRGSEPSLAAPAVRHGSNPYMIQEADRRNISGLWPESLLLATPDYGRGQISPSLPTPPTWAVGAAQHIPDQQPKPQQGQTLQGSQPCGQPHSHSPARGRVQSPGLQDWAYTRTFRSGYSGQTSPRPPNQAPLQVPLSPRPPAEARHQVRERACQLPSSFAPGSQLAAPLPSGPADRQGIRHSNCCARCPWPGGAAPDCRCPHLPAPQSSGCRARRPGSPLTSVAVALSPHQRHCSVGTVPRSQFSAETKSRDTRTKVPIQPQEPRDSNEPTIWKPPEGPKQGPAGKDPAFNASFISAGSRCGWRGSSEAMAVCCNCIFAAAAVAAVVTVVAKAVASSEAWKPAREVGEGSGAKQAWTTHRELYSQRFQVRGSETLSLWFKAGVGPHKSGVSAGDLLASSVSCPRRLPKPTSCRSFRTHLCRTALPALVDEGAWGKLRANTG
ncbi:rho GTPase-activating protein 17-like [Acinonyx jubatus]|uniref:Rho GTPase-activating protein 17-like n=1 Tax=Acinonyx jubatus TaxID=32536 RepID=A0ABM3PX66_ACIJB|nr:rho GTPase-activating protein 17-like [Acinonyx jubatus]